MNANLKLSNIWKVTCLDINGKEKWTEEKKNLITTEGLNHILNTQFDGGTQVGTWYIGLKGTGAAAAADTLASQASWSEKTVYTGNRQEWTNGTSGSGSMTNSTAVSFSMTATETIAGAFLATAATGTTGTLYGVVDFSSSRAVASGDTLQVTVTVNAASS
ncbi:MAG: hypothetical protein NZ811_03670 [Gammaproteobacteria bacterium]|nr:hypothetical protein [Gammaproteobacteria bacterium]